MQKLEGSGVFAIDDDLLAGESVASGIVFRCLFAFGRFWSGGMLGIVPIGKISGRRHFAFLGSKNAKSARNGALLSIPFYHDGVANPVVAFGKLLIKKGEIFLLAGGQIGPLAPVRAYGDALGTCSYRCNATKLHVYGYAVIRTGTSNRELTALRDADEYSNTYTA